jgi:hypothetical protein
VCRCRYSTYLIGWSNVAASGLDWLLYNIYNTSNQTYDADGHFLELYGTGSANEQTRFYTKQKQS